MAVNLRDVAARAGVSVRTVSNVVNDYPHVAPATRARVQEAIAALGYRPNLAARQLRRGRAETISLVVPEIDSPYFSELASLVVRAAEARGWSVHIDQTGGEPQRERRLLAGPAGQTVDGVVFNPWAIGPEELDRLGTTPLVLLGEREAAGRIDHVAIDNVAAARDATEHLLSLGRRRIAAIGEQPHLENNTARLRVEGYEAALRGAGLEPDPALRMAVRALHRWDGAVAMVDLLDADKGLDAVFCFTDQLALGAMRVLAERGLHVPEDVAVVGFDDIEDGRYHVPSLTTVSPDKAQIAELALNCLARRIAEPETDRPGELLVADHVLRSRESTGVRNERIDQQTKQKRTGSHS